MTITREIQYPKKVNINVNEKEYTNHNKEIKTSDLSTSSFIILAIIEIINILDDKLKKLLDINNDDSFKYPSDYNLIIKMFVYVSMLGIFITSPIRFLLLWIILYFLKNLDLNFKTLKSYSTVKHAHPKHGYSALSTERITEQLNNIVVYKDGTVTRVHKLVEGVDSEGAVEFLTLRYEDKPLKTQFTEVEWEIAHDVCDVPEVYEEQVEDFIEELEEIKEYQEIINEQEEYKKAQESFKTDEVEETHVSIFDNIISEENERLKQKYNDLKNYVNSEYDQMKEHEEDYQEEQSDEIQESRFDDEGGVSDTQATVESNQEDDENENK